MQFQYINKLLQQSKDSSKITVKERSKAEALFASIGDGAVFTDEQGNINRINNVALDLLGYNRKELVGKWFPEAILAEDEYGNTLDNMDRPVTQAIMNGRPYSRKIFFKTKKGGRLPVSVTASPVLLENKPIGVIEVFRDITKDIELDKAKSEFISIASHQLRTPATGVKQYIGMLLQGYAGKLTKKQREMLEAAYENNERQLIIVEDLLRVARAEASQLKPKKELVDIIRLASSIVGEQVEHCRASHQELTFSSSKEEAWCKVDPLQLRMVLENIIDNAHKYTFKNKRISVSVKETTAYVSIDIKDEGVGIAKKDMPRLFQKFSRIENKLSSSVGGSGLGLFWAKKLVDSNGGQISVKSKLGAGTTFNIKLSKKVAGKAQEESDGKLHKIRQLRFSS